MKKIYLFLVFVFSFSNLLHSQMPDAGYGTDGRKLVSARNTYAAVSSALIQSDNKLLIGGSTHDDEDYNGKITVWRLNADGTLDNSFGNLGLPGVTELFYGYSPLARGGLLALQPDNKILVAGTNISVAYPNVITLARLKPNGKLDSTFGENGASHFYFNGSSYANAIPYGLAIKSNKKIVINGDITLSPGRAELIQVRPNGELDSSFGVNGVLVQQSPFILKGLALAVAYNDRIIGGFEYIGNNGKVQTCLKKFKPTGAPDSSFGINGIVLNRNLHSDASAMALVSQPDGKIVEYTTAQNNNILLRYKKNGDSDLSFGNYGRVYLPFKNIGAITASSIAIDKNGKILITVDSFSIARYLPNGVIDSSFGTNGFLKTDFSDIAPDYEQQIVQCIAVQPDTKIVEVGRLSLAYEENDDLAIARYIDVPKHALVAHSAVTEAIKMSTKFVIYPNPVNNMLTIHGLNDKEQYSFEITNAAGTVLIVGKMNNVTSYNCNVQKLNSGVYYAHINSDNTTKTLSFIKQ